MKYISKLDAGHRSGKNIYYNTKLLLLCAAAIITGCTDKAADPSECDCLTGIGCTEDECSSTDNNCNPPCNPDTQACINSTCQDKDSADTCKPACDAETQACVNKTCQYIDPWCEPGSCHSDRTKKCVQAEGKKAGKYETCPAGTGCFRGECIEGLAPACTNGQCNENKSAYCFDGEWTSCGDMQKCTNGACQLDDVDCDANTCIPGYPLYYCNSEGKVAECGFDQKCSNGHCVSSDGSGDLLWTICNVKSDCSFGVCLKSIKLSEAYYPSGSTKPVTSVSIHTLDPRIPEGKGVCSYDCTIDSDSCKDKTGNVWGICQLAYTAESPYKNTSNDGTPLSFPLSLDQTKLESGVAYASLCRPIISDIDSTFKTSFCKPCESDEDCAGYACKDHMCLTSCSSSENCPLGFTCIENLCVPPQNTCTDCRDIDKDGYGFGNCPAKGVDCDDSSDQAYWQAEPACLLNSDLNCNGYDDSIEMLGTVDNCMSCGDVCKLEANSKNMSKACVHIDNNGEETGKTHDELDPMNVDAWKFSCVTTCAPGYADCNGDPEDGCELKIGNVNSETGKVDSAAENGQLFAIDKDDDGFGDSNVLNQYYCCPGDNSNICYSNANTSYNPRTYWSKVDFQLLQNDCVSDDNCLLNQKVISDASDCNDNNKDINPSVPDICDGIDNNCNGIEDDGSANLFNPKTRTTYAPGEGTDDTDALSLNQDCYNYSNGETCGDKGKVTCSVSDRLMYCKSSSDFSDVIDGYEINSAGEAILKLDGVDDNCNGITDEDGMIPCIITATDYNPTQNNSVSNVGATRFVQFNAIGLSKDSSDYNLIANSYMSSINVTKALNFDNSLSLCRLGIVKSREIVQSGVKQRVEVCESLYKPYSETAPSRQYDYFGDGIDANCDGYDYDLQNAIFVDSQDNNAGAGNDETCKSINSSSGSMVLPCKSLQKALEKSKMNYEGEAYADIIISKQKVEYTSSSTEPAFNLSMPSLTPHALNINQTQLLKIDDKPITKLFTLHNELAIRTAHEPSFKPDDWLFATEECLKEETDLISGVKECVEYGITAGSELPDPDVGVRIYGGFERDNDNRNAWKQNGAQTTIDYIVELTDVEENNTYAQKPLSNNYIMFHYTYSEGKKFSLYLQNLNLEMHANLDHLPPTMTNGTTFTGINGYSNDVEKIEFVNTTLTVTAPEGYSFATPAPLTEKNCRYGSSNDDYCRGTTQMYYQSQEFSNPAAYGTAAAGAGDVNLARATHSNDRYTFCGEESATSSLYNTLICNDYAVEGTTQSVHRYPGKGGVGGGDRIRAGHGWVAGFRPGFGTAACDVDDSGRTIELNNIDFPDGVERVSAPGGAATQHLNFNPDPVLNSRKYFCIPDSAMWPSESGYNGKSGVSGTIDDIDMKIHLPEDEYGIYINSDRSAAHGKTGQNGGGGAGGMSARVWNEEYKTTNSFGYCFAGWGGNGGCGGHAGRAGGIGGSAIGISLKSSSSASNVQFVMDKKSSIQVTNGSGGRAENGGMGGSGTRPGFGMTYAWEMENEQFGCIASTGGAGGGGGGGGAGAGGRAGMAWPFVLTCADSMVQNEDFTSSSMNTIPNCGFNINIAGYTPANFNTTTLKQQKLVIQNANDVHYYKDSVDSYEAMRLPIISKPSAESINCKPSSDAVQEDDSYSPKCEFHKNSNCEADGAGGKGYITIWGAKGIVSSDETAADKSSLIKVGDAYQDLAFKLIIAGDEDTMKLPLVK